MKLYTNFMFVYDSNKINHLSINEDVFILSLNATSFKMFCIFHFEIELKCHCCNSVFCLSPKKILFNSVHMHIAFKMCKMHIKIS